MVGIVGGSLGGVSDAFAASKKSIAKKNADFEATVSEKKKLSQAAEAQKTAKTEASKAATPSAKSTTTATPSTDQTRANLVKSKEDIVSKLKSDSLDSATRDELISNLKSVKSGIEAIDQSAKKSSASTSPAPTAASESKRNLDKALTAAENGIADAHQKIDKRREELLTKLTNDTTSAAEKSKILSDIKAIDAGKEANKPLEELTQKLAAALTPKTVASSDSSSSTTTSSTTAASANTTAVPEKTDAERALDNLRKANIAQRSAIAAYGAASTIAIKHNSIINLFG